MIQGDKVRGRFCGHDFTGVVTDSHFIDSRSEAMTITIDQPFEYAGYVRDTLLVGLRDGTTPIGECLESIEKVAA